MTGFGTVVEGMDPIGWAKEIELRGLRTIGLRHFTSEPIPCHDPPVAWRVASTFGQHWPLPIVCCPALLLDGIVPGRTLPGEIPVLDAEPGRRP